MHAGDNLQARIGSISQGGSTSVHTHGDTADEIADSDRDSSPEDRVSGVVVAGSVDCAFGHLAEFGGEDDGHDDTVDSHDFTEDNRDQVLGSDSGSANTTADDR